MVVVEARSVAAAPVQDGVRRLASRHGVRSGRPADHGEHRHDPPPEEDDRPGRDGRLPGDRSGARRPGARHEAGERQQHRHGQRVHGQPRAVHRRPVAHRPEGRGRRRAGLGRTPRSRCATSTAPATSSARGRTSAASTGTPAYSPTNTFLYTRDADQFEQVMAYFWVNQAQEYLQSLGFGTTLPPGERREPGRAHRPVRRRQHLLDGQARLPAVRQGRRRRRRGRRGDRARVRPRRARRAGARLRHQPGRRLDRRGVRRLPRRRRSGSPPRSSTAGRSRPRRPARWTGTPPPTPPPRTASAASTAT